MKAIYTVTFAMLVSSILIGQENKKDESKKKHSDKSYIQGQDKIKQHEKIIWAGTGVDLNEKSKDVKNVPDAVMNSFRQFFPNQPIDNVRRYHGLYAITFSNEVYTTTLVYKADGTFVEARTVATESAIPTIVKEEAKRSKGEFDKDEIVVVEKANKRKYYRLHFKNNSTHPYSMFDESGKEVEYDY